MIYFVGIAGSAMASAAIALAQDGIAVIGSDSSIYPPMSDQLSAHGIEFVDGFSEKNVANAADRIGPSVPLFVIGNAMSRGNPEIEEILNRRLPMISLPALIGERMIGTRSSLVLSGTHGKTTSTALLAWVLESAGKQPGFLVGGVPRNFETGCRMAPDGAPFVVEGDEYDTAFFDKRSKFVHYRPTIAVINNIEFDHADIFESLEDIKKSFRQLLRLIPENGCLVVNGDDPNVLDVTSEARCKVVRVGLQTRNDLQAVNIEYTDGKTFFTIPGETLRSGRFHIPLSGEFNVRNALGVAAVCMELGLSGEDIQRGFGSFLGIKRRMEVIAETNGIIVIDDFAHHPTAIRGTLEAVHEKYPGRRILALFEPRSNTTTRNIFQRELAESFGRASLVIIGALNRPERYADDERLSVETLCRDLQDRGISAHSIPDVDAMISFTLKDVRPGDVIVLLSNGSFGGAHEKLVEGVSQQRQT